ncbi:MAG: hypothetical protein KY464_02130 [Gemmatimonadetes bacterium]|nr:hypothetical protein [Gemmatimonadota bacterium]
MYKKALILAALVWTAACQNPADGGAALDYRFDFRNSTHDWAFGFADYPSGQEVFYELAAEHRFLPAPLRQDRKSMYMYGNNHSDDLIMYMRKQITGLKPNTEYRVRFVVEIASNAPLDCGAPGGPVGESVYLKAGATAEPPVPVANAAGYFRLNVDIGSQSNPGRDALVLGHIARSRTDCFNPAYELKRFDSRRQEFRAKSGVDGSLWLLVATDSGQEASTGIYYTFVGADLTEM